MGVSQTSISNRALAKLGEPRISDFSSSNTKPAKTLNEMYESVRDALLQAYPWNFSIELNGGIAKDGTSPEWEYDNRFLLPNDCLRLLAIKDDPDYRVRKGYIHTNDDGPLKIRYIQKVEDEAQFSPLFVEAFASKLAYESAEALTQSNTKKQAALQDFDLAISQAMTADAIENPPDELPEDEWIEERA